LLITARDAAASLHLIEIAREATRRGDFSIEIATQRPATRYFRNAGIRTHELDLPPATGRDTAEGASLMKAAEDIIRRTRPQSVLCGLSTPFDGGIDEAITASFQGPKFVMQDFWGEANLLFGKKADLYFALDAEGVRLSNERHGIAAMSVGSPRHSAYRAMDIPSIRKSVRERLGIAPEAVALGFFGQALHAIDGYRRTLEVWADAVASLPHPCMVIYRPHPREQADDISWSRQRLSSFGTPCIVTDDGDVEHSLLACDVVCSAFSNCTYDVAYLNYFSSEPLITPVALFFDQGIVEYFHRMVRLAEFPYLKAGLVMAVRQGADLAHALSEAATADMKSVMWQRARKLADPVASPALVLNTILKYPQAMVQPFAPDA
jgi:hypothetical protein